jgi:hypothetical protein
MRQGWLGLSLSTLTFAIGSALAPPALALPHSAAHQTQHAALLVPTYQRGWRQQIRVAAPVRNARWDRAPRGAVRVYHRRFDPRWQWRSAPRHRVVYTYFRGDVWFLDPTTGWAYSVDRYGIVYTADPYRGTVYSLGPLTRWTADLLYFFDFYHFDRGYWYLDEYDYFVDLWEDRRRYDYYTYDTAYSTVWTWEPYFSSPVFYNHCNRFSTVWVSRVRNYNVYIERNPYYRREVINTIGLPAIGAAPPVYVSPRAVATTAYWEARDLAAAGVAQPTARGRDLGLPSVAAGTVVDARTQQVAVPSSGAPVPGFNAPFPDGSYGFGAQPNPGPRGIGDGKTDSAPANVGDAPVMAMPEIVGGGVATPNSGEVIPDTSYQRGRDEWQVPSNDGTATTLPPVEPLNERSLPSAPDGLRDAPAYEPQQQLPREEPRWEEPRYEQPRIEDAPALEQPRFDEPRYEEPRLEREEPRYEEPRFEREEPRYEEPRFEREEPRYEGPRFEREEPRFEVRDEPRYEAPEEPRFEAREEPSYEREEPSFEREEPSYEREEPSFESPRDEPQQESRDEPQYE